MPEKVHVPDSAFIVLAVIIMLLTYGLLLFVYPELPLQIPTHYDISGQPDAASIKNVLTVFFPAFLQTVLTIGLLSMYRHPQYAHVPGTLFLPLLPTQFRQTIEHVIKHMIVMIMLLLNLIFANIALSSVMVAFHLSSGLNIWLMGFLVLLLVILPIEYTLLMTKLVKRAIAVMVPPGPTEPKPRA